MTDNWQKVGEFLLRNRNIREMVDEILKSIPVDVAQDCDRIPLDKHRSADRDKTFKVKRKLTVEQTCRLLEMFQVSKFPAKKSRAKLAGELNIPEIFVKCWFCHRRAREIRHQRKNNETPRNTDVKKRIHCNTVFRQSVFDQQYTDTLHQITATAPYRRKEMLKRKDNNKHGSLAIYSTQSGLLQQISDISDIKKTCMYSDTRNVNVRTCNNIYQLERNLDKSVFSEQLP